MIEIFQKYMGTGLIVVLFLAAVIYLLLNETRKPVRILFVYVPIVILLIYFNPLFFRFFYGVVGEEIYFRICWLLPIAVVIAYAVVSICEKLNGYKRICFALVSVAIVMVSGKLVYSSPLYGMAENRYHVPQKVVDICDAIKVDGREVMAAFPDEFLLYVRQYSPFVCMPYGREALQGVYNELRSVIMSEEIEVDRLAELAKAKACHYVIFPEDRVLVGEMEDFEYELFDTIQGYLIYKDTTMNFNLYY